MCPTAVSILDILLSVFENLMLPSCWDLCMRTSTVHLFISSRGLLRGMKGSRRVWAECDCSEAEEKIPRRVRTTLAVSWADWCMWVTGCVCGFSQRAKHPTAKLEPKINSATINVNHRSCLQSSQVLMQLSKRPKVIPTVVLYDGAVPRRHGG